MTAVSKLFKSTTFRLSLFYVVLVTAAAAVSVAYINWNSTQLLDEQLEATIQAETQGLAEQYRGGGLARLINTVNERSLTPGNSLYLVANASGEWLAGNLRSVSPALLDGTGRIEFFYSRPAPGGRERRLAEANMFQLPGGYRLIVGRDIEDRREFSKAIRSAMLWGLAIMLVIGIGGGWLVSRHLLARIDAVTDTSQTIMEGNLTGRVPVTGSGDELDRLSENLNAMLDRIEQLMNGLREVSDNIAHDLKTPLNRLRNRVEDALRNGGGESVYREALQRTIEEADDLIKTFNALLSIARLEAGEGSASMGELDLGPLVDGVAELYEPVTEENGIALRTVVPDGVRVRGNRQLLGQAVANLLDNAIKYGSGGSAQEGREAAAITLEVAPKGARAEIVVADRGPGIPQQERERALKRFVRLEASRSQPGSGLGLSLVAAVARLHGGTVRLEDNEPGLRAIISLPVAAGISAGSEGQRPAT